jgi:hypothetical protein
MPSTGTATEAGLAERPSNPVVDEPQTLDAGSATGFVLGTSPVAEGAEANGAGAGATAGAIAGDTGVAGLGVSVMVPAEAPMGPVPFSATSRHSLVVSSFG